MDEQLDELVAERAQIGQLLELVIGIPSDLDLDATLHRIISAALSMTGARYAAIGLWSSAETFTSFVHAGIDEATVQLIGHLPVGKGVLGVLRDRTDPLRMDNLTQHPAAAGFPEHHPPMRAFLGMPIIMRDKVFGGLFVADDRPGHAFTESDEVTARALASAASVAIDNARLFERVSASARWTHASRQITTALLSDGDPRLRPLQLIVERAAELTDAEQAIVLVPADHDQLSDEVVTLVVSAATGVHADEVLGQEIPISESTTGEVFRSGEPLLTERFRRPIQAFTDVGERPAIVMPLRAKSDIRGVIVVARNTNDAPFDESYLDLVRDFAGHAAIALELAAAREQALDLGLLAERERIAHDLHDQVIQQLFATGLDLQGTAARSRSPEITDRLTRAIDSLQGTIETIRSSIFALQHVTPSRGGLRQRINALIAQLTEDRDIQTSVEFSGPLTAVGDGLAEHAESVISEAVSNAVRHSGATHLKVAIQIGDEFVIDVTDDGRGIPATNTRSSGLTNMAGRAEQVGGHCEISTPPTGGTHVHWAAPLM
jgi:signal transduction histidine kinase